MKPLKNYPPFILLNLFLIGVIWLAACNTQAAAPPDTGQVAAPVLPSPEPPTEVPEAKQLGQTEPLEAPTTAIEATEQTPVEAQENQEQAPGDQDLEAEPTQVSFVPSTRTVYTPTDPAMVNLEAGQLQFVKFFAFW